ncbi:MAG TPA: hypothetical protein PLU88_13035 [Armatimonadota bacterium]|nr:hypothetical protein [Armatimonadota bacterium]
MQHANLMVYLLEGIIVFFILYKIFSARAGRRLFIRRIPGLTAIDEAVGRATEMGRPMMFSPGIGGITVVTLQALSILGHIISIAARYRARIIVPTSDPMLYTIAEETVRDAYESQGIGEIFNRDDIRFVSSDQFAYASGVVGILNREKVAGAFYFGDFFAESLILAENGQQVGAIQVAGTPQVMQIPFFIAACDYTIIGDEYYAASAYLSREPTLLGSLVGQDYSKAVILFLIIIGIVSASFLAVSTAPFLETIMLRFTGAFSG